MKKTMLSLLLIPLILVSISGCVPLIVGGAAGALGAVAVSKDTIQTETDKPYDTLWNSALRVARIRGTIKQEDSQKGFIELEADQNRVWVRLIRLTPATTRLRVSCRNKLRLPNIDLAQDIFVKIMEEAR